MKKLAFTGGGASWEEISARIQRKRLKARVRTPGVEGGAKQSGKHGDLNDPPTSAFVATSDVEKAAPEPVETAEWQTVPWTVGTADDGGERLRQ
jgi:hypothetical protein